MADYQFVILKNWHVEPRSRCTRCGAYFKWRSVDGVLITVCDKCRKFDKWLWEDRHSTQPDLIKKGGK
jgi:hypothetical protein